MRIHDLLTRKKEEILDRWRDRVLGTIAPQATVQSELLDSLPTFMDELAEGFKRWEGSEGMAPLPKRSPTAQEHGSQRFRAGFSLEAMVHEYGVLREVIVEVMEETGIPPSFGEVRLLTRMMTTGISEAVSQFTRDRDEQMRKHSNEHFAFLAHELRNPLGSARIAISLIDRKHPGIRDIRTLDRSISRVIDLIDQELSRSRAAALRSGDQNLSPQRSPLLGLLSDAAAESAIDAEQKEITISVACDRDLMADADPRLMRSAVTNLIRNAIKFTHTGGKVSVRCNHGEGRILIEVEDECGGLPPGMLEKLFAPFAQAGADRSGFGLGLAIAREAVEAHRGVLEARDLPGKGCVFVISLPTRRV